MSTEKAPCTLPEHLQFKGDMTTIEVGETVYSLDLNQWYESTTKQCYAMPRIDSWMVLNVTKDGIPILASLNVAMPPKLFPPHKLFLSRDNAELKVREILQKENEIYVERLKKVTDGQAEGETVTPQYSRDS